MAPATTMSSMLDMCMDGDDKRRPEDMKYRSVNELLARIQDLEEHDYSELACEECGSKDNWSELLICDKCEKGYHMKCTRPIVVRIPIGNWFCTKCAPPKPVRRHLTKKKINEFFGVEKCAEEPMDLRVASDLEPRKRKRRARTLVMHKKQKRLLAYVPTENASQRLTQMKSLASALIALNLTFSPELTYQDGMAPRSANKATLENGGMQVLSKDDRETLSRIHAMGRRGLYPPLMVVYDAREGYTVVADGPIKDLTLLAEYGGDVDFLKKHEEDDCDSLMTLVTAQDPAKSLVVYPNRSANISRFISGVNNHKKGSKKKQNTKCVRFDVGGEARVLWVATRNIAKGDKLYCDYNEHVYEYPTHHFV